MTRGCHPPCDRRLFLGCLAHWGLVGWAAAAEPDAVSRGRHFLVSQLDPALDLLPEFPGANVYWLWHDNGIAAHVLAESHPDISRRILAAIDKEQVPSADGKMELLLRGRGDVLPFRHHRLVDVRRVGVKRIRTEISTADPIQGWQAYADLLLLAALAEQDQGAAKHSWDTAWSMWDGLGFADAATTQLQRYATYKLGLALVAAHHLGQGAEIPASVTETLRALQAPNGGWYTDYLRNKDPVGQTNVESTCIAMLGLGATPGRCGA